LMHQLLPGLDHLPQLTHAATHGCRVSLRKRSHVLARTRSQAGHARQKVRTPQSEKSSNRGPQMIFLMNCDKSLPRIRGGLFPSCLGSHHPVPVPGNECGEKVFPEFGEGFFPRAARLLCGLLDPWRSAVASWACAAIKDPTTSSLRPRGRQHVFYRMYWGFGRFASGTQNARRGVWPKRVRCFSTYNPPRPSRNSQGRR
jgi:hypothetical protein